MRNKSNENNKSFDVEKDDAAIKGYTDPKRAQRDHRVRLFRAGVGIIVVLALIGASIYGIMHLQPKQSAEEKVEQERVEKARAVSRKVDEIDKDSYNGDTNGSLKKYDSAIKSTEDNVAKSMLLLNKSVLLFNNQRIDEAQKVAQTAYDTNKSYQTASWIAKVYEKQNDKQNALKYYNETLDQIPNDETADLTRQEIKDRIKGLK